MEYYVYILYSEAFDTYCIGSTQDYFKRLYWHNNGKGNTFTARHRPWQLKGVFDVGASRGEAKHIEQIIDPNTVLIGKLAQLVRVPRSCGINWRYEQ